MMNLKPFTACVLLALSASAVFITSAQAASSSAVPAYVTPPSVFSSATVKDFLADCTKDQGGCADEVGTALSDRMAFDGSENICLPGPDFTPGVLDWLKAHPETGSLQTEDGIYLALKKAYPCG